MADFKWAKDLELLGWLDVLRLLGWAYAIIVLVFYFAVRIFPNKMLSNKQLLKKPNRILLVISHPDDECLFFGPTIVSLLRQCRSHFYLLCLSNGDYDGKGRVRQRELWNSCVKLGILPENITMINHDLLRDNPKAEWSTDIVGKLILTHVLSHEIDTLITFDQYGISGHNNHRAVYFSVKELTRLKKMPLYCSSYALESVNMIRKYMPSALDIPFSVLTSSIVYVADKKQNRLVLEAMSEHASQAVWFRYLYLYFSRYLQLNTLRHIAGDLPLHSRKSK